MPQTPEDRMYRYFQALRHNRLYRRAYFKGECHSPYMMVAMRFKRPVRVVKEIIAAKKGAGGV